MSVRLTILKPECLPSLEASGLRRYEDYIACTLGETVGRTGTTQTRRFSIGRGEQAVTVYLKVYRHDGDRWRHRFRLDKALLEARNYRILQDCCAVNVPEVIAHGSRRRGLRLLDAFLVTAGVPNAAALDQLFSARWPVPSARPEDPLRKHLLGETASIVSRMHAAGFFHIDLQWRNLLAAEDGSSRPEIYVIDSARGGLRRNKLYQAHGMLRDLSSLSKQASMLMTRTEQIRWLRRYWNVARFAQEQRLVLRTILLDRGAKDHNAIE